MRTAVLIVVVALAMAGCADGGGEDTTTSGNHRSPIAEALGFDVDQDPAQAQAEAEEQQRQVEAFVVDCMAAQGFEYEPVDYGSAVAVGGDFSDLEEEERVRTIGFGFTHWVDQQPEDDGYNDPNQDRVEAMDEATRDAYYAALYGESPEATFDEDGEQVFDETYEPSGCQHEGWQQVNQGIDEVFRELEDDFDELYQRIEADPRLVEVEAAWSECMAERGFDFRTMEEIYDHLNERMEEDVYLSGDAVEFDEEGNPIGPGYDEAGLAEVREEEIAIAVADYECAEETGRNEVREEVQVELEEAFIEQNRAVFDRARAALES